MPVPRHELTQVADGVLAAHPAGTLDAHAAEALHALPTGDGHDWRDRDSAVHVTVSVVLVHRPPTGPDRVLLTLHPRFGRWMQLGGHLEPGDRSLTAAAVRETLEESGQDPAHLSRPRLLGVGTFPGLRCGAAAGAAAGSTHLDVRYLVTTTSPTLVRSAESTDLAWWPLASLPDPHDDDLRLLARQARAEMPTSPVDAHR